MPMPRYLRTCQECGHTSEYKDPATYKDKKKEAWRDTLCKKCHSEGLDYGSYEGRIPDETNEDHEELSNGN